MKKTLPKLNLDLKHSQSLVAVLIVAMLMGSFPPVTKQVVVYLEPPVQLAIRYLIAALFLMPSMAKIVFDLWCVPAWKNLVPSDINIENCDQSNSLGTRPTSLRIDQTLLTNGILLGILTFGTHLGLSFGVQTISANRTSFLFGLCVIIVALIDILYKRQFSFRVSLAAIFALSGSSLMSWEQSSEPLIGSLWVLGGVTCEAIVLIALENTAAKHNPLSLSFIRLMVASILSLGVDFNEFLNQLPIIQSYFLPLLYLGGATAATTWLVIFALQTLPAVEAALIQGLEPIFGSLISFVVLGEVFGIHGLIGSVLILIGIALAVWFPLGEPTEKIQLNSKEL